MAAVNKQLFPQASGSGANGTVWYSGSGAPTSPTGVDGDYYLNTTNGDVYKKVSTSWTGPIENLIGPIGPAGPTGGIGPTGLQGAVWYTGSGAPSGGTGVNGDFYLDSASGNVYTKVSGSWGSPIENIIGPAGAASAYAATIGDGSSTSYVITHGLGTSDVVVRAHLLTGTNQIIEVDTQITSVNSVTLVFAVAPASNTVRVVVLATGGSTTVVALLAGPATQYVNASTGNDTTGNGSSGSPWATITKALSKVPQYVDQDYTINVADGTYAEGISITNKTSFGSCGIYIVGNLTTMDNVVLTGSVAYPSFRGWVTGTACVFIDGPVNVHLHGMKTNATATISTHARNGAGLYLNQYHAAGTVSYGIFVASRCYFELKDNITVDTATTTGITCSWLVTTALVSSANGKLIHIVGPGSVTVFQGIVNNYNSTMSLGLQTTEVNVTIENVLIGIQLGLSSSFQMFAFPGTLQINNTSTPTSSAAVQATDQSSFSGRASFTFTHFTFGLQLNSIAYGEHDSTAGGSFTTVSVGTVASTSTGAIWNLF